MIDFLLFSVYFKSLKKKRRRKKATTRAKQRRIRQDKVLNSGKCGEVEPVCLPGTRASFEWEQRESKFVFRATELLRLS